MKNKEVQFILKCVKVESVYLSKEDTIILRRLFKKVMKCKNHIYGQFHGIKSLEKIQKPLKLRTYMINYYKDNNLMLPEKRYRFLNKHYVRALIDACSNLKSNWSNLANTLKTMVRENDNIEQSEKAYLYYILSSPSLWFSVLNRKDFKENNKLKSFKVLEERKHYLFNYLRRITRKKKFKTPKSFDLKSISLDEGIYSIETINNNSFINIATDISRQRIKVKLKSKWCYKDTGNLQLIFIDSKKGKAYIKIHKCIETKPKTLKTYKENKELDECTLNTLGVDKGYHDLLSCSDNNEYGKSIGDLFTKYSNILNKRNTNRNYFIQLHKDYVNQLKEIDLLLQNEKDKDLKTKLLILKKEILEKIKHIETYNLGNALYSKQNERIRNTIEQEINIAIKEMISTSNPSVIAKESLKFEKTSNKGSRFNRNMSNWLKGFLDERLEHIAGLNGIEIEDVNPAYTSKFCAKCGAKLIKRKGKHSEIGICPNCGEINANTNAAKNILARLNDEEITLYTPYKKVDKILLDRYNKNK